MIDYAATAAELVERGEAGWLRTYRDHERGDAPLVAPGEQDITIDVPREYLVHAAARAGFRLRERHDAGGVAAVARRRRARRRRRGDEWEARAHVGDLEAVRHRSRVSEGAALTDPGGLGAHRVLVFTR